MSYVQLQLFAAHPGQCTAPALSLPPIESLAPDMELSAAITAYIAGLQSRSLSPASRYAMANDLRVLGKIIGMGRPLNSLTRADFENALKQLMAISKPSTVERRMHTLNSLLKWLFEKRALPVRLIAPVVRAQPPLPVALTHNQVEQLLNLTHNNPRTAFLVRLVLATGLKPHEVMALRITDLDFNADLPCVVVGQGRKRRRIAVPAELRQYYQAYLDKYAPMEQVFPITARQLGYELEALKQMLGVPINFSTLRWTCALNDYLSGKDPERLRLKLGLSEMQWRETLDLLKRMAV